MNTLLSPLASKGTTFCTRETVTYRGSNDIKRKANSLDRNEQSGWAQTAAEAIINSCKSYSDALRQKRLEAQNSAQNVQKQKYHYKNMSSNIIRSKTSTSARQVVSQTTREIQRLKKAKASGKYDEEELDAAIAHAKSMERIARKKVRHLEEEEMAKASGKGKYEEFIESAKEEKVNTSEEENSENAGENVSENVGKNMRENSPEAGYTTESYARDIPSGESVSTATRDSFLAEYSDMIADFENMTSEMLDEITASMDDMLKDMGLEELSESLLAATGKMDEHDIKMMEISHRNKEMKEIVKADAEYLKAIFEHYENIKSAALPVSGMSPEAAAPPVSVDISI